MMKFTCSQIDIHSNLSLVNRAVPSRPSHPILANVLLKADKENQRVQLTGFDLSLGLCASFSATVESEGTIVIAAKLLSNIISRLPSGEISFETTESTESTSTLTSLSGKYSLPFLLSDEFPSLPEIENSQPVSFSTDAMRLGLRGSLFATSTDETKQVLTGLHVTVQSNLLKFAATDGHRLAVVETANESEDPDELADPFEITIPAKALQELERMIGSKKSDFLKLHIGEGQIIFDLTDQQLTSRILGGKYPNYQQLIPTQFERQVNVDRKQLLSALERIGILASQQNHTLKVVIDAENQQLILTAEAQQVGSGQESISAQISGDDSELILALNVKYAIESLKNLTSTEVQIQLNSATTPVVLNPLAGEKITHLLMPVQLRD